MAQTKTYHFTVLEARSLRSRCRQGWGSAEASLSGLQRMGWRGSCKLFSIYSLQFLCLKNVLFPNNKTCHSFPISSLRIKGVRTQVSWDWILNPGLNLIHLKIKHMLFCLEDATGDWETQKKIPVKLLHCLQAYCVLDVVVDTLERAKKCQGLPTSRGLWPSQGEKWPRRQGLDLDCINLCPAHIPKAFGEALDKMHCVIIVP